MPGAISNIASILSVLMILGVAALFMVDVPLPPSSHLLSALAIIAFALPSFWAARRWLGWRDAALLFGVLGSFALLVEYVAVITAIPYGRFEYSNLLGYKLFGAVPWTVAVAWTPLVLGAYSVSANLTRSRGSRMIVLTCLLIVVDLVLDPGAVKLRFWNYGSNGFYYGVPLSNFAGWFLSGSAVAALMEVLISRFKPLLPVPVQLASSAGLTVYFWTVVAAVTGLIFPAAIGMIVMLGFVIFWRRYHFAFDDMIVMVDDENNAVGTGRKLDSHHSDTRLHRAFSVFLFNARGELLLQQRSFGKKTWPGVWSNSCCGHVMLHESVENAARRRLKYELGLRGTKLMLALPDFRYRAERDGVVENEICPVLIGFSDTEPIPNMQEVASIRWISWEEFLSFAGSGDSDISPWAIQEAKLLAESDLFQEWFSREVGVPEPASSAVC